MKKFIYTLLLAGIILATQAKAQNYWLEFKVNDSTRYYPITEIQKIYFSDINENYHLKLIMNDSTSKDYLIGDLSFIEFGNNIDNDGILKINFISNTNEEILLYDISHFNIFVDSIIGGVNKEIKGYKIVKNHPNPFDNDTKIYFNLYKNENIYLKIVDNEGNELLNKSLGFLEIGEHQFTWDGKDKLSNNLSSGIYNCIIYTNEEPIIHKMIKIK